MCQPPNGFAPYQINFPCTFGISQGMSARATDPSPQEPPDPIPDPEPASPSLDEPDPGVFHHDPVRPCLPPANERSL
jgi:hypothetical protein